MRVGSPAIDAGLNAAPGVSSIDFESDLRIIDGDENGSSVVDIGADEFIPGQTWSDNFRGTPTVTYSDVDGSWPGTGNINADPVFIDPDGVDDVPGTVDDDFRLDAGSPAVDAGDNSVFTGCVSDLDRAFRYQDDPAVADTGDTADTPPYIDMGAYERSGNAPGDILNLDQDISQSEDISACTSVTLGNGLSITGSVTVNVQAGKSIELAGEFGVGIGAIFSALVAPLP